MASYPSFFALLYIIASSSILASYESSLITQSIIDSVCTLRIAVSYYRCILLDNKLKNNNFRQILVLVALNNGVAIPNV